MKDRFKIMGIARIRRIRKSDGKILDEEIIKNTVVADGKERVARLINGNSSTYFDYIAIGTGVTGALVTDTELETEVTNSLATLTYEADYKAVLSKTFTFSSGDAYEITEAGVFDDGSSGATMFDRFTFSSKSVDADTDLEVKITITVS